MASRFRVSNPVQSMGATTTTTTTTTIQKMSISVDWGKEE